MGLKGRYVYTRLGQSYQRLRNSFDMSHMTLYNLPENQCVFIRGFRVAPSLWILPKRLKAGPSSDPGGYDSDPDMGVISIPAITQVKSSVRLSQSSLIFQSSVILFTSCQTISPR
jgi:hypothetical protein